MQSKSLNTITDRSLEIIDVLIPGGPLLAEGRRPLVDSEGPFLGTLRVVLRSSFRKEAQRYPRNFLEFI